MKKYLKENSVILYSAMLSILFILILILLNIIIEKNRDITSLKEINKISEREISYLKEQINQEEDQEKQKIESDKTENGDIISKIEEKAENRILIGNNEKSELKIDKNKFIAIKNEDSRTKYSSSKIKKKSVSEEVIIRNITTRRIGENIKSYELYWPINSKRITSEFGMRMHPVLRTEKVHRGVDIAVEEGEDVYSGVKGVVTYSGERGNYGNMIELERNDGLKVRYAHLSKINVSIGQLVNEGEKIGESGNTGMSTGPHLHYEVLIEEIPVNPLKFKYRN